MNSKEIKELNIKQIITKKKKKTPKCKLRIVIKSIGKKTFF